MSASVPQGRCVGRAYLVMEARHLGQGKRADDRY
jgi:hypothetical protein